MKSKALFSLISCLILVVVSSEAADLNVEGRLSVTNTDPYNTAVSVTGAQGSPHGPSMRVTGDGGVYFVGKNLTTGGGYNFMTSGYGMYFDSKLSALYVGNCYVIGARFSLSVGEMAVAQGENSAAIGKDSRTLASDSLAVGKYSYAYGASSVAMGNSVVANGASAFAAGSGAQTANTAAVALNAGIAAGAYSTALGQSSASGTASVSMGSATAPAAYSVAVGRFNKTVNINGGAVNGTGWADADPLFSVGNGTGSAAQQRKDAFVVYKDGRIRIDRPQGDILMGDFQ